MDAGRAQPSSARILAVRMDDGIDPMTPGPSRYPSCLMGICALRRKSPLPTPPYTLPAPPRHSITSRHAYASRRSVSRYSLGGLFVRTHTPTHQVKRRSSVAAAVLSSNHPS